MIFHGNGTVWDADKNKPLCHFIKGKFGELGTFETDERYIIDKLVKQGYTHDSKIVYEIEDAPETPFEDEVAEINVKDKSYAELLKIAKDDLGMKFSKNPKKIDLINLILGGGVIE